jgi:drug/metabolite transporter (DMT)-like permease
VTGATAPWHQDSVPLVTPQTDRPTPPWVAVAVALGIVYVVWGSTYLFIRIVVEEASPLTAMGQRYTAAGLLLGAAVAARSGLSRLRVTRRELLGCGVLGLILPLLGNGLVSVAEDHGATSGYAALLIAVSPLAIVVFRTVEHDRPRPMTLVGVLSGFGGLALLVALGRGGAEAIPLGPALLVLFAGTCWALGSYIQPRLRLPRDPFVIAVYEMFLGGLMMTVTGMAAGESWTLDYGARTWWALGYLVVLGSVVAFSTYVWLIANAPISLVATYAYVNPVIAVLLGWLVLGETITGATFVGGAVVVASVAVVITSERRPGPARGRS